MPELEPVVYLIVGVVIVNGIAGRIGIPAPILLVLGGLGVSFIPGTPDYQVNPELVLTVLLPPLLYAAAVESSVIAIRRLLQAITQLAFGMVLVTAFAVAVVLHALIPEIPFAAALALGAIVAPPDAVAAVAVARRAGLPRRVVTVLEGESLFNDATSLVLLRVAVTGIAAGSLAWGPAIGEFAWATVGGLLIGAAVGLLISAVRRFVGSSMAITALSFVTPFLAYHVGERAQASGVLAVVVSGLVLGFRAPFDLQPEVRLTMRATWNALQYVLEGSVFALIGLQLWAIVTAPDIGRVPVLLVSGAVLLTVILIRPIWIFSINAVARLLRRPGSFPSWRPLAAVSWAGMRGVVSLAAAQTLPFATPYRSLLLTCTIAVILGTLVVQGLTLPAVIRAASARRSGLGPRAGTGRRTAGGQSGDRGARRAGGGRRGPAGPGGRSDAGLGGEPGLAGPDRTARSGGRGRRGTAGEDLRMAPRTGGHRARRVRRDAQFRPAVGGGVAGIAVRPRSGGGTAGPADG